MRSLALFAVIASVLVSCGQPPKKKDPTGASAAGGGGQANSDSQGSSLLQDKTNFMLTLQELEKTYDSLALKAFQDGREMQFLERYNQKMCERIQKLRDTCLPSVRVLPDAFEKKLACKSSDGVELSKMFHFQVHLTAPENVVFRIIADNTYESNDFESGESAITWATAANTNIASPRLYDFRNMKLKVVGGARPALTELQFELRINDRTVLSTANLVDNGDATSFSIRTEGFLPMRRSNACRVSAAELEEIRLAEKFLMDKEPATAPTPLPKLEVAETSNQETVAKDIERIKTRIADLQPSVDSLKRNFELKAPALERERDREGKLSTELLSNSAAGCFARQPLNKLEILVNGAHLEEGKKFETENDKPAVRQGSAKQFTFTFGQDLAYTNSDEETTSLLRSGGAVVVPQFKNRTIGDIESISIAKGGVAYRNTQRCWQEFLWKACVQDNWEINRYRLDSLIIKVNDEVLYQKEGINFTFEGTNRVWEDKKLSLNPDYLVLMNREDCPVK